MAEKNRLFEKTDTGLLVEVDPAEAPKRRDGRTVSHVALAIDVLWTAEEEVARQAQEARQAEAQKAVEAERQAALDRRAEILGRLGLTEEEVSVLLAGK